jgi:transcriptional regulator with XRE-family HTH domain
METNLITKLQDKEYRDAFVASQINVELPFQVRALREKRGWTQSQLAEKAGMAQPRISAMETPGKGKYNLETLRRLASAFDIGLTVRFAPFSELIEWTEQFSPDSFQVPSFVEDMRSFYWKKASTARPVTFSPLSPVETSEEKQRPLPVATNAPTVRIFVVRVQARKNEQNLAVPPFLRTDGTAATAVHIATP